MPLLPRRISLIEETVSVLRQRLDGGEWSVNLPGERELAALLDVGRNTLRAALRLLEDEGRLRTTNGIRREIVARCKGGSSKQRRAVLLMEKSKNEFPPSTSAWIGETARRLENLGWTFRVLVEPTVYRRNPAATLRSLCASSPGTVWILHRSTVEMQRWFQARKLPAVLAGSRYEGIVLPQVEIDMYAVSHHAAGRFLARGHRRLAILRPGNPSAGADACVAAFREGARYAEVAELHYHEGAPAVAAALHPLLHRLQRPTGLYVLGANTCVTVLSVLQHEGVKIPQELSLICREDAPYLALLFPEPSRYRYSARTFAARLAALVTQSDLREAGSRAVALVMPHAVEGATLAQAPVLK